MTRADELKAMLNPARGRRESFKAYRKRRALANASVKAHLKGRMAHVSTQVGVIPEPSWTDQHAAQVARGRLIVMGTAVVQGKPMRLVRTKGVTSLHRTKDNYPNMKRRARRKAFDWKEAA